MKLRLINLFVIVLMVTLVIFVFGTVAGAQGSLAGITIRILGSANTDCAALRDIAIKEFVEQSGATVKVDLFPYGDVYNKEVLSFVGQQYDLYWVDSAWIRKFIKSGYLEPLESYIEKYNVDLERFYPIAIENTTIDGHIYGVPTVAKPVSYGYRKDVFEAKGIEVPQTWAEVLDAAKKLNDPSNNQYGFVMRTQRGNPICWTWMPILRAFGGEILDQDTKPIFNSEQGIASVEFMKELYQYSVPGSLSTDDVRNALANGVGMQTTIMSNLWPGLDDPEKSKVVNLFEFADMPTGPSGMRFTMFGGAPYCIAASSSQEVKDATFQLLAFFLEDEIQEKLVLESAWFPSQPRLYEIPNIHRSKPIAGRALNYAKRGLVLPEAEECYIILGTALQDVLLNNKPIKQTMDEAAEQIRQLLDKAGYYKN